MKKTGTLLFLWAIASVAYLMALEWVTLADGIQSNHITAVVRRAFDNEPGIFMWLAFSSGWLGGHLFWAGKKK